MTAFQLDIKCEGLDLPLMRKALEQARVGRLHILGIMKEACSEHATKLPPSVPRIIYKPIDPSKVGKLIGGFLCAFGLLIFSIFVAIATIGSRINWGLSTRS